MPTILGSIVNMIGEDLHDHLRRIRIFTLIMNKIFIRVPKITRQRMLWTQFGFVNHLALIACFIFYEKWVQREKILI